jgi:hypothetical protein
MNCDIQYMCMYILLQENILFICHVLYQDSFFSIKLPCI